MKTADYIRGSKDRAQKIQPSGMATQDYFEGYEDMHNLLVPTEQEIVLLALRYRTLAEQRVRELEEEFRDRGNAGDAAAPAADPAFPGE